MQAEREVQVPQVVQEYRVEREESEEHPDPEVQALQEASPMPVDLQDKISVHSLRCMH